MPKHGAFFDLVERTAARQLIPPLEMWEATAKALLTGDLPAANLSDCPAPHAAPKMSLGGWLRQVLAAVQRGSDARSFRQYLNLIVVRKADFEKWLRKTSHGRRGPLPESTGYQELDRKLFPLISRLRKEGTARGAFGAALELAKQGKIKGNGTLESKARRVASRYLKERQRA
jgi:hypothetical protein